MLIAIHIKKKKPKRPKIKRTSSGLSFHNPGVLQRRMATRTLPSGSSSSEKKKAKNTVRAKRETRPRLWELGSTRTLFSGRALSRKTKNQKKMITSIGDDL